MSLVAPPPVAETYAPERTPDGAKIDALTSSIPVACKLRENVSTIPEISSEAQIEGARFCKSVAIMLLANPALANTSP